MLQLFSQIECRINRRYEFNISYCKILTLYNHYIRLYRYNYRFGLSVLGSHLLNLSKTVKIDVVFVILVEVAGHCAALRE